MYLKDEEKGVLVIWRLFLMVQDDGKREMTAPACFSSKLWTKEESREFWNGWLIEDVS